MKTILSSRKHPYLARVGIFLIAIALIVGTVSCDGGGGGNGGVSYTLTMAVFPPGSGTTTPSGTHSYAAGAAVSIKAVAAAGYRFVNWTASASTFANANVAQTTFTMPAQNITVTANFALFAGGNGTEGDPYQIADWYQLDKVRNYLDIGIHFILVNDLDSTTAGYDALASPAANQGQGWQPIGTGEGGFRGDFDGQRYEICDLFIDRPDEDNVGLFGVRGGGIIKNVGVVNCTVSGNSGVGGLTGKTEGGIVGKCYATGNVTGDEYVGGLMGYSDAYVYQCYSAGSVTGGNWTGGLVGWNSNHIDYCYSISNVTGNYSVGGLVGLSDDTAQIWDVYAAGSVDGEGNVGGLLGENYGYVGNYTWWDIETSGQNSSAGGTGKTTALMKKKGTYYWSDFDQSYGWGIQTVSDPSERNTNYTWNIVQDVTYPFLSWQPV
jgi:uncharacterized repeat protein (TIGR02543 family)